MKIVWILVIVLILVGCRSVEGVRHALSVKYPDHTMVPIPNNPYCFLVYDTSEVRYVEFRDEAADVITMDVVLRVK